MSTIPPMPISDGGWCIRWLAGSGRIGTMTRPLSSFAPPISWSRRPALPAPRATAARRAQTDGSSHLRPRKISMPERGKFSLDDYVTVAERVSAFYAKFPDGSLQSEIVELNPSLVVMRAYAYRTPDDQRPGIGYSSLGIPGTTPYTRNSEVENCESSAWGRAIAALGFEVKRGIASAEEVRNKREEAPK